MKKTALLSLTIFISISFSHAQWQQTSLDSGKVSCLVSKGDTIFAGSHDGVLFSSDNGISWTEVNAGLTNTNVTTIAICRSNIFVGTWGGGVFKSPDYGNSWSVANNGLTTNYIWSMTSNDSCILVGADNGKVFLSTDDGDNWTSIGIPISSAIMALAINDTNIYAGTDGVYLSTDNGSSWTSVDSGLSLYSNSIYTFAVDGNVTYLGSGMLPPIGEIYKRTNNGTYWINLCLGPNGCYGSYPTQAIMIHGTNIFAGNCGGIRLSTNDGGYWFDFNDGLPNTCIYSFATIGDTIFTATDTGVWKHSLSILTGVENVFDDRILIFPNPANDKITIEITSMEKDANIFVFNIQGQLLKQQLLKQTKTDVDLSGLVQGLYIMKINSNCKTVTTKFLKE